MYHNNIKLLLIILISMVLLLVIPAGAIENFKTSSYGAGHQIWFEAEDFDERNPDNNDGFALSNEPNDFGKSITNTSGDDGEYMLRYDFDISRAGGSGGTWYFWGRVINPTGRSSFMLVEGHPGDPMPVTIPMSGLKGKMRIFEDHIGDIWTWANDTFHDAHTKTLRDGMNTMYILAREDTGQMDVFMWTDDPNYVPTDVDYKNAQTVSKASDSSSGSTDMATQLDPAAQTSFIQGTESVPANCLTRHRILVSTDAGGTDPDDLQSLVHLFVYADCFDIEGIVSSPWGEGRKEHILEVIDLYERDYPNLKTYSDRYPTPDALRAVVKQGAVKTNPEAGFATSTEGSDWIIECARCNDPRPLYVLVWGGIDDLAQALHDAPDILPELCVYWIGGPNKKHSRAAYNYIHQNHLNLWIIEANTTYRGWFWGGNDEGQWDRYEFVTQHVAGHGALGDFFAPLLKGRQKMGDSPSVGWLLKGNPDDPSQPGWGGKFVRIEDAANRPNWWTDDPDPAVLGMRRQKRKYAGALTVSQWREDFLGDFAARMDRCKTPATKLLSHEDTASLDLLLQYAPADEELAEKYKHYLTQELGDFVYDIQGTGTARIITKTIVVPPNVTYDGKGEVLTADANAMGAALGEQSERQKPLFLLAPGAAVKNVTITDPGCEGIHMMGDNVLDNITWEDVGEDAASVRSYFPGGKITIKNSKAFKASDKMFQFNTSCSVRIENFVGDGMGKLVRHMGSQDVPFKIDLSNVTVTNVVNAVVQSGSRKCHVRYHNLSYKFKGDRDRPERVFRKIPPENVTEY